MTKLKQIGQKRKLRKLLRKRGFHVYVSKRRAIRKAKKFTRKFRIVYWVLDEAIGYYVIHTKQVHDLNVSEMRRKGAKKIRSRDLDQECIWRSPNYDTL